MKTEIDIYDFDKTLVPFDSGSLFIFHCLVRYPWIIVFLPLIAVGFLLMMAGAISINAFKRFCFCFVPFIPLEKAVKSFWDRHEKDVFQWFKERERYAVVISASPDFLLEEIQKRLGFEKLICSRHGKRGELLGENCRGEEKVRRLYEEFNKEDIEVIDVYSDSVKNDMPIFLLATRNRYQIVKGRKIRLQ